MKHFKIIQKIPAQCTEKTRTQRTRENSHIGHCIHTAESTNAEVYNFHHGKQHYMYRKLLTTEYL